MVNEKSDTDNKMVFVFIEEENKCPRDGTPFDEDGTCSFRHQAGYLIEKN